MWITDGNVVYKDMSIVRPFSAGEAVFEKQ